MFSNPRVWGFWIKGLEIGELGAQVKHIAKKYKGSCYAIDRRKH